MTVLFTDTDTDFTPVEAARYGYRLISMPYCVNDEVIYPYESFDVFDSKAFYDSLRKGTLPTTSALSPEAYKRYFEPVFAAGDDIFYVHFSAAMTATFASMDQALAELKEKYPERKFWQVDTKGITICSYNIVKEIGEMFVAGKTPEEIIAWADVEVDKFATYFYADNLTFFRKSGRVSGLTAAMGNMIGIRPIITMNSEGKMVNVGMARGRENAIAALLAKVDELGENLKDHTIVVGQSDAREVAERIIAELREKYGEDLRIDLVTVNPTAGSHCGPDGVGICFHAVHR